ncbi:DUF2158 domain-containing protein [Bradyrhizobium sp. Tv2a-2]|uniref:DUF2158 domain-containing protein n=1 Tax=Bradyrhizobium sp. Tv2a-2 TaxID=113395 RepID=UPI0006888F04|nr:DUF2158 domain-containing protein [Bradyrhizobium sp. Tv2a-2]
MTAAKHSVAMAEGALVPGDVVRLKGQLVKMTIDYLCQGDNARCSCVWFVDNHLQRETFSLQSLARVRE